MKRITSYQPQDISFSHGEGHWLWDTEGKQYFDALCGIAVTSLGHNHPQITKAIQEQASKLLHTSNLFQITEQNALAERLTTLSGMEQVFFGNSGAEANEAAIKIARLYGHAKGIETPSIIVMEKAFHGRTMATLTASAGRKGQAGFEPLVAGFVRAPYNDIDAIDSIGANRSDVVAIMLEPIQGEGGVNPPDDDYLIKLRQICDDKGWLLILDEIQTGIGRTGKLFDYMHSNITPDVLTTAKALGNGVPIGACLMRGPACNLLQPGKHGSTFGGNPLACKAALTVLDVIEETNLCDNAEVMGDALRHELISKLCMFPEVRGVRGKGLMIGIELDRPCRDIYPIALKEGLLFSVTSENVLRLLPPLTITQEDVVLIADKIATIIERYYN
jgi:acetylornithine aminotransferase